jgi:hypothetical protein
MVEVGSKCGVQLEAQPQLRTEQRSKVNPRLSTEESWWDKSEMIRFFTHPKTTPRIPIAVVSSGRSLSNSDLKREGVRVARNDPEKALAVQAATKVLNAGSVLARQAATSPAVKFARGS